MGARVLVVDDEQPILRTVAANLRARDYQVLTATSGEAALAAAEVHQPDCVVLDLGLPGISGLEALRRLRTWTTTPVVILTAVDGERDKVAALDLGADDYVTKPFGMAELLARIRVALRHGQAHGPERPHTIQAGDVTIDLDGGLVIRQGEPVRLSRTKYRLRGPGHQRRPALHPPLPARTGLGAGLRRGIAIPAGLCGQPPQEAG
jgi:two-component system KDP operon response regulator KdpE